MSPFTPLPSDWEGTEWRRWETGAHPVPRPHLSYLPSGTEPEGVTKARALGAIREGLVSCLGPAQSTARGHPKARCWPQGESGYAPSDIPKRCCVSIWGWRNEWEEERQIQMEKGGQVEFRADSCQLHHAAGKPNCFRIYSRNPALQSSVFLPFPPPHRSASFVPFNSTSLKHFLWFPLSITELLSLLVVLLGFRLLLQLAGVTERNDICGEAVFQ